MQREVQLRWSSKDHKIVEQALKQMGDKGTAALRKLEKAAKPASKSLQVLDGVAGEVKGSMTRFTGSLGPLGAGLQRLGPVGLAAGAGIAAVGFALKAGLERAKAATEFSAELLQTASRAGLAVDAFQELTAAGGKLKITQEALFDGFKEMNLRADEFAQTGAGSAAEAYKQLGLGQAQVNELLKDSDKLFQELIRRMEGLDRAAQIRLADEFFGGQGGEQFVSFIEQGVDAIAQLRIEARELGLVMDSHLVRRGAELNAELDQMQRVIDVQLNAAFLDLAPVLVQTAGLMAEVAHWVGAVVDGVRDIPDKTSFTLEATLPDLKAEAARLREGLEAELNNRAGNNRSLWDMVVGNLPGQHPVDRQRAIDTIEAEILAIETELAARAEARTSGQGSGGDTRSAVPTVSADQKVLEDLQLQIRELTGDDADKLDVFLDRLRSRLSDDAPPTLVAHIDELGRALFAAKQVVKAEAEATRELARRTAEATRIIEATRTPQEDLTERLANLNALYEEGRFGLVGSAEAMETLSRATEQAHKETDDLIAKESELGNALEGVGAVGRRSLGDIITGSKTAGDALQSVLKKIQSAAADFGINTLLNAGASAFGFGGGSGGFSFSAKGNVFDNGNVVPFAKGGITDSPIAFPLNNGLTGIAGEAGKEGILPLQRTPDGRLGVAAMGAGNADMVIHQYFDSTGPAAKEQMREAAQEIFAEQSPTIIESAAGLVDQRNREGRTSFI